MDVELFCIDDYEEVAAIKMSEEDFSYFRAGVGACELVKENTRAYKRWRFRPRLLRDVSRVNLSTAVCGKEIPFPICIAPTAVHKTAHIMGEVATAKAAESLGIGFTLSTFANCSMEEVAREAPNCLRWCHIQVIQAYRDLVEHFVRRAEESGFSAFIMTVDQAVNSKKRYKTSEGKNVDFAPKFPLENLKVSTKLWDRKPEDYYVDMMDGTTTWEAIGWMKTITNLPIIVKGILTEEMATKALEYKVKGIIVSNHGGRQLDDQFATIDSLPEVLKAVNGRCDVYMDGGIRRGSDIAKAIALGAKAVFIGRPVLWGLACDGENGVRRVLEILRDELTMTMRLLGVTSLEELRTTPNLVVHENTKFSKL